MTFVSFAPSWFEYRGYRPAPKLQESLAGIGAEVHAIGDFVAPRSLMEAIHEGSRVGALS